MYAVREEEKREKKQLLRVRENHQKEGGQREETRGYPRGAAKHRQHCARAHLCVRAGRGLLRRIERLNAPRRPARQAEAAEPDAPTRMQRPMAAPAALTRPRRRRRGRRRCCRR
eukprot:2437057-Pleurochrysis_carterae.AAC.2